MASRRASSYGFPVTCSERTLRDRAGTCDQRIRSQPPGGDASGAGRGTGRRPRAALIGAGPQFRSFDAPQQLATLSSDSTANCGPAPSSRGLASVMPIVWFVVVVAGALYLAYERLSLRAATMVAGAALAAYSLWGSGPLLWMAFLWVSFAALVALNIDPLRKRWITRPFLQDLSPPAALDVGHRARGARGGHRLVGRRALHGQARLVEAHGRAGAASVRRRSRPSSTAPARNSAACSTTGTSPIGAPTCRRRSGSS